ncbi:DEAD/DEAH box helicase [Candidatus Uhrbacteria bacterium]|nr:DEAD/DEAH box helicase [Candidatus Uhrbacteria bacterium]
MPRELLPIIPFTDAIIAKLRSAETLVVAAETGAGKSTEIGPLLLKAGFGKKGLIGITEPRRIAAVSLCEYVSELMGEIAGNTIGFQIRNERRLCPGTRVKFMTEGILLAELHSDPLLRRYEVIVVDEAHERGINQDLILALLQEVRQRRPDLKIVIMSATIDEERFAKYFGNCPIVKVPGRLFPVETRWLEETSYGTRDIIRAAVSLITDKITGAGQKGDLLVFMPDEQTIKQTCKLLEEKLAGAFRVLPLYGNQAPDEQRRVFERIGQRRIIVATNIAETSITLDGIVHVVDSGLIKAVQYVNASMSALQIMEHSKAGCRQRQGRAGRTQPGVYWPLFDERNFAERPDYTEPELKRMTLDQVLLHLRALGYSMDRVMNLRFMDPPGDDRWKEAEERLKTLGALDQNGQVTEDGRRMEHLPVAPMAGRMILAAEKHGCLEEVVTIVSGLAGRPVFVRPKEKEAEADAAHQAFKDRTSDALTMLSICKAWQDAGQNGKQNAWARDHFLSSRALGEIDRNRDQIIRLLEAEGLQISSSNDPEAVRRAIAAGLIINLCVKSGPFDYLWQEQTVRIHPGSGLFKADPQPQIMVCGTIIETTRVYARDCTAIDPIWLDGLVPETLRRREWEIRERYNHLDDNWDLQIIEKASWQGIELKAQVVQTFPAEAIPFIAGRLAQETLKPLTWPIHAQTPQNRIVWPVIKRVLEKRFLIWTLLERADSSEAENLTKRLILFFCERIKGTTTLLEVAARDISLKLEDWLSPEQIADQAALLERKQAAVKEQEQLAAERRSQYQAKEQEQAEARSRLLEEIRALENRAASLSGPDAAELRSQIAMLRRENEITWANSHYFILQKLKEIKASLQKLEREEAKYLALGRQAWAAVTEQFPLCPLCGNEWIASSSLLLLCQGSHDPRRIIALEATQRSLLVGRLLTDRDEEVAEVRIQDLSVQIRIRVPAGRAWSGKVFKSVVWKPSTVILPPELVAERESIIRDLGELRQAREELEAVSARLREAEKKVGAGAMKLLVFKLTHGQAVAEDAGISYQAAYGDPYPSDGERWFCRIGRDLSLGGKTMKEAHPEFKASAISTPTDLEELCVLLRETYPGLPDQLLFAQ